MGSIFIFITIIHLIGLALGVGAATVKNILLLKCNSDYGYIAVYKQVVKILTRTIITGMTLLTLSGISWFFAGYSLNNYLIIKIVLVLAIWVLGPIIDNVIEPRFFKMAPAPGESPSPAFIRIKKQYLALDLFATALFYSIIILWIMR